MDFELDLENSLQNEFTGARRESLAPPGPHEPICLISYEITYILLGGGPDQRSSFWRSYRRELELNQRTQYQNYHVSICRHHLMSLRMNLKQLFYFRNQRLTPEKSLDPMTAEVLTNPRFVIETSS